MSFDNKLYQRISQLERKLHQHIYKKFKLETDQIVAEVGALITNEVVLSLAMLEKKLDQILTKVAAPRSVMLAIALSES